VKYKEYDLVCFGTPLVEIMRKELENPLHMPFDFTGPYPSGDTAIMIDSAANMGARTAYFGVVGNDDFGRCIKKRLENDGVDTSGVRSVDSENTGIAFVAYFSDGCRKFIFTAPHSAARLLCQDDINYDVLSKTKWLHISGFPLCISESSRLAIKKALAFVDSEVKVSFDPNLRHEVMSNMQIRELCDEILERCDLFLPSAGEAALFSNMNTDEEGCRYFSGKGKLVVMKQGKYGCVVYSDNEERRIPSFSVEEVDPTGAGDVFCGAFIAAVNQGKDIYEAGRFANAAGALSVTKKGPMEGIVTRQDVEDYLKTAE